MRTLGRHVASLVATLVVLFVVDARLSDDRQGGGERKIVRTTMERVDANLDAKVFTFGCSTRLNDKVLSEALNVPRESILDGHMGGCHQGCSFAEVRRLLKMGRRFERAFFAYNLFEACEHEHSKRTLQAQMMLPLDDVPLLFGTYLEAKRPARQMTRFVGATLSGAYADTTFVRHDLSSWLFGKPDAKNAHRWVRAVAPAKESWSPSCDFDPDDTGLKFAFTDRLLADMRDLAEHSTLVLLPDRTVTLPEHADRWARYRAQGRALVEKNPHVTLVDLSEQGTLTWDHFRDGAHLNKKGQAILLARAKERIAPLVPR